MANKIKVKLILELRAAHMGRNAIAHTRHMSVNSVGDVFHIADRLGITFEDIRDKDDAEVYNMFYPDKHIVENMYRQPDFDYVHSELKRVGVTLKLLWQEYSALCASDRVIAMGYTRFCNGYSDYTVAGKLTNHIERKPGITTEVDWSGSKMLFQERLTGVLITVHLFVATLPYSQYSYVEPCLDMKQNTWLRCNIHMYEFFNGVSARTVCDNLKTGVVSHPREGDIILNKEYEALGSHYMTAIMPTGVKKPKQKASVESTVGKIATAIIAKLRNEVFYSFEALSVAVREKLDEFNAEPFQKREGSRKDVFMEERESLRPLPAIPYEIAEWIYGRSVYLDCHVAYGKNRYSCPYQYVGKKADLKVTEDTVEIYIGSERVATHIRYPEYVQYRYSTHPEDMPDRFQRREWDDVRITNWADSIGINTGEVIRRIFVGVAIKEQGYNPSLSVLQLGKRYADARLEIACEMALVSVRSPRYHHIKTILASNQDLVYAERKADPPRRIPGAGSTESAGYVRGADYYGGGRNDE
jgi:transposase